MPQPDKIRAWVDAGLELRAKVFKCEAEFYLYLIEGEHGACPWKGAFASFEQLIRQFNVCDAPRYASFRNAVGAMKDGAKLATEIGVDGVITAAQVHDKQRQAKVILTLTEASRERKGVPLSFQEAQRIKQSIDPIERTPRRLQAVLTRSKLEEENASLRKRVKQLETENAKLKAKITKLEGRKGAA